MQEIANGVSSSGDPSKVQFGAHGRLLDLDADPAHGVYTVRSGDSLWAVAKDCLAAAGHSPSNQDINRFVRTTVAENHIRNADRIGIDMKIHLHLPALQIAPEVSAATPPISTAPPEVPSPRPQAPPSPPEKAPVVGSSRQGDVQKAPFAPGAATASAAASATISEAAPKSPVAAVTPPVEAAPPSGSAVAAVGAQVGSNIGALQPESQLHRDVRLATTNFVVNEGKSLHHITTIPVLSTGTDLYDLASFEGSKLPLIEPPLQVPLSANGVQDDLDADLRKAKQTDPVDANAAIQAHELDLKSETVNSLSTFTSGFGSVPAAELTLKALATAGVEAPDPWFVKIPCLAGLALLEGLTLNEAQQATAHYTLGTKMDSQGKIVSDTTGAVLSAVVLKGLHLSVGAKVPAFKFGGLLGTGGSATFKRGLAGLALGSSYAVATQGPWNINPATREHFTVGETAVAAAEYGAGGSASFAFVPHIAQLGVNGVRNIWAGRRIMAAGAATNAVYEAGIVNPTQINPENGKHYTFAETAAASAESLPTGAAGGIIAGKLVPAYLAAQAWIPAGAMTIARWSANESAGAAIDRTISRKAPGLLEKTLVKPVGDAINYVRRYLGRQVTNVGEKIGGEDTLLGKHLATPVAIAREALPSVGLHAGVVAAPATHFVAPVVELRHWNQADRDSEH